MSFSVFICRNGALHICTSWVENSITRSQSPLFCAGAKCKGAAKTAVKPTLWECATCRKDNRDGQAAMATHRPGAICVVANGYFVVKNGNRGCAHII